MQAVSASCTSRTKDFPARRRGRAKLGTSQQSLERHAFLARRDVSRASGCFSRVGMPSAARKAFPAHGEGGAKRRMRSFQRARYPHPVSRMPCALAVVRCAAGYIIGKDRRFRRLYEFADPLFLFIPNAAGRGQAAAPTAKTGVRCDYLWKCQNPPWSRRDPSSVSAPQDDAPSGSRLRAARNHIPRRGGKGVPLPPGGASPRRPDTPSCAPQGGQAARSK